MRILFMGTPDFAEESLRKIYEEGHEIIGVVTNPDKKSGRGMKLKASPVKEYALKQNLPIFQPIRVRKNEEFIEEIKKLNPDVICVVAYGKILPKEILEIPKYGAINAHASLLPKYRGAAPIQWAILNGDKETGVDTMYMDEGMDTGNIIFEQRTKIDENETTGELWDRLKIVGAELLSKTLKEISKLKDNNENIEKHLYMDNDNARDVKTEDEGKCQQISYRIKSTKQGDNYTMAPMIEKSMAKIDWNNQDINSIHNLIRGLNPIMGAYSFENGKKIKFWRAEIAKDFENNQEHENSELKPGTILVADPKLGLFIKAKGGILKILEIQGENAKKMDVSSFLRGNKLEVGTVLE